MGEAYDQTGQGYAADLRQARDIQKELGSQGIQVSRKEAMALVAKDKAAAAQKQADGIKALKEALPAFIKDGRGVRGPQPDATKKLEIVGADGSGNQMQIKPKAADDGVVRSNDDDGGSVAVLGVNENGLRSSIVVKTP